jgi:hypothetical protein
MIIASIGKDEQGAFSVMCTPHLAKAEVNGVKESGAALRCGEHHAALQVFDTVGEGTGEFGALIEADQKELILGVGGLEELQGRFAGLVNFVGHAAAVIEDHPDGNGNIFGRKGDDLLLGVVFVNAEIVLVEAGDQPIEGVSHGDVDQSHVHVAADYLAGNNLNGRGVTLGIGHSRRGRRDGGVYFLRLLLPGRILGAGGHAQAQDQRTGEQAEEREDGKPGTCQKFQTWTFHGSPISPGTPEVPRRALIIAPVVWKASPWKRETGVICRIFVTKLSGQPG